MGGLIMRTVDIEVGAEYAARSGASLRWPADFLVRVLEKEVTFTRKVPGEWRSREVEQTNGVRCLYLGRVDGERGAWRPTMAAGDQRVTTVEVGSTVVVDPRMLAMGAKEAQEAHERKLSQREAQKAYRLLAHQVREGLEAAGFPSVNVGVSGYGTFTVSNLSPEGLRRMLSAVLEESERSRG